MSPMLLHHVSPPRNRESILATGLEPRDPRDHNYPEIEREQPTGVYCTWADTAYWPGIDHTDLYDVVYCGPITRDSFYPWGDWVVVLLDHVPPEQIALVRTDL